MTHWVLRKGKYWTLEESYRVPGKRTPRKRVLARKSRSGTINPAIGPGNAGLAVALPFMIVHDLVSGKRVADFKEYLASGKHHERHYPFSIVHDPRHVVSEEEWGARVSQMSRAEFDRYMAHARAEIASGKQHTNTDAMKAARGRTRRLWMLAARPPPIAARPAQHSQLRTRNYRSQNKHRPKARPMRTVISSVK
jgi:hypothetical protein